MQNKCADYVNLCKTMLIYAKLGENKLIKATLCKNMIIYTKFGTIMQKNQLREIMQKYSKLGMSM